MAVKERYSVGEVSKICNVSKKALRYYDKIGLIQSERDVGNNYRYYETEALLAVPVIKYYKQMGFTLEEMSEFIEGDNVYRTLIRSFSSKIDELEQTQKEIHLKYASVKDWYDLILEAEMVTDYNTREVSIKYVEPADYLYLNQTYKNNIRDSIINVEFTNHVESVGNAITGPVWIHFSSYKDRMGKNEQPMQILQKTLLPCRNGQTLRMGGKMMISCYHIGTHDTIDETYQKMCRWALQHDYMLESDCYERYVTDYWTTKQSNLFVTEILMAVSRK